MAIINRVQPRPYVFDDPQGSDEDVPIPWAHSSHPHGRYCHEDHVRSTDKAEMISQFIG